MSLDLQQIQGGQQILVSRKGAKEQRRCLAMLFRSHKLVPQTISSTMIVREVNAHPDLGLVSNRDNLCDAPKHPPRVNQRLAS